jgi:molybdopterin-guanine dinucleotide biosynthesis protein A
LIKIDLLSNLNAFLDSGDRKIDRWYAMHDFIKTDFSDCADMFRNINTPSDQESMQVQP